MPVYDKPIDLLSIVHFDDAGKKGIHEILIISTPHDLPNFKKNC
jgi:glucose-1-phosphate thymidylyltransferase